MYVHLHTHSYYSILEGLSSPANLAKRAKELGSPALALTDRSSMYGAIEFYKACKEEGIRPVIGCEMYLASTNRFDTTQSTGTKRFNIVLIAENHEGYKNLLMLTTKAYTEGFYYKPRIDKDLLREHSKGLICLTSNIGGEVPKGIIGRKTDEELLKIIEEYHDIFGKENVFLELEHHPDAPGQDLVNEKLISLARTHDLPLVVANNAHYARKEDQEAHEIILCLQSGKDYDDPSRFSMREGDYSLRDFKELQEYFKDVPEAFENTIKIAERCSYDFQFGENLIPSFEIPKEENTDDPEFYFRKLCYNGLLDRYELDLSVEDIPTLLDIIPGKELGKTLTETSPEELKELAESTYSEKKRQLINALPEAQKTIVDRLEYEICVINEMGFCTYFLIVQDFVNWAKSQDIAVGPGRGSAAGAIIAYVLKITDIDPLHYNLLFERFLNPARVSMPDIDMDFEDSRRNEVLEYVANKYGRYNVAQVATFGTLKAKQAVKDVGRSLAIPYQEMDGVAKKITEKLGTKLAQIVETNPEIKDLLKEERYKRVFDLGLKVEGVVRQIGVHACAVMISEKPLTEYTALQYPPKDKNFFLTQYSMKPLEMLGLLKMDFLGLRNLTILQIAKKIIKRTKDVDIDLGKLPLKDQKTFELFSRGDTKGVFQFESEGMRKWLKELKPDDIEDIIAMASMYRPGPLAWIPVYVGIKHNLDIEFPDDEAEKNFRALEGLLSKYPEIKEILDTTNMIPIYQEQILQIAQRFSGFSLGQADLLRRAIGKKIASELMAQKKKFIDGAVELGRSAEDAKFLFERGIEPFADYGFNKSHAACYAVIAYQTAYLKAHYPTEFMTALLSTVEDNTDKLVIQLEDATYMGIEILAPDINESLVHFTAIEDGVIRFGLNAIKGLGQEIAKAIVKAREAHVKFETLEDFLTKVPLQVINRKTMEALILGGALDCFGYNRGTLMRNLETLIIYAKEHYKQAQCGQTSIFSMFDEEVEAEKLHLHVTNSMSLHEALKLEKQYLGFYVTGHPLQGLSKYIAKGATLIHKLSSKHLGKARTFVGIVSHTKKIMTKTGKLMVTGVLEDPTGEIPFVMFPKSYDAHGHHIQEDAVLKCTGTLDSRNGASQLLLNECTPLKLESMIARAKDLKLYDPNEQRIIGGKKEINNEAKGTKSLPKGPVKKEITIALTEADVHKLAELKDFLSEYEKGSTSIALKFAEKIINTPYKVQGDDSFEDKLKEATGISV